MTITIDTTYGDISREQAEHMARSVVGKEPISHFRSFPAGATEPWIGSLVASLLKATGIPVALETGVFMGHTSVWLSHAIQDMGGGTLHLAEIDPERASQSRNAIRWQWVPDVDVQTHVRDALSVIADLPDNSLGMAFLDDDHTKDHVAREIEAVWPKMASGGIVCFHDVYGVCDLQEVVKHYGGYSLDFPRCGPAGGLGILQVR